MSDDEISRPALAEPDRSALPDWPRLMSVKLAAAYLSLSGNTVRTLPIEPARFGKRVLYDRKALDRWADSLGSDVDTVGDLDAQRAEVEGRFLAKRRNAGGSPTR